MALDPRIPSAPMIVQKFPTGLLDALGLRGTGDAPHLLEPALRGTFEMAALYMINNRVGQGINIPVLSNGFTSGGGAVGVVPAGEIWVMLNISLYLNTGAGGAGSFSCGYRRPDVTFVNYVSCGVCTAALGASVPATVNCVFSPFDLILRPGDAVGSVATGLAGTPAGTCYFEYYRLPI